MKYNKNEKKTAEKLIYYNKDSVKNNSSRRFMEFLNYEIQTKSFIFYLIILLLNMVSLLIKFSIGLYGYSGNFIIMQL